MPIFFQQDIDENTKLAIWKIEEDEPFFTVPLQREITHPHKRLQHLAGRYLLRYLVPDFPLSLILIADTRKPYLKDEAYHFSISHCGDYAAAIVSKTRRVGIDIEVPAQKVLRIQHKFLHPEEQKMLEGWGEQNVEWVTLLWSAKEALFKWWGRGDVDFSEVMRLYGSVPLQKGTLTAQFSKPLFTASLALFYQFFPSLVLSWVASDVES